MADANKTEKPTPRKRQKAREKGQVARSRELSSALAFAGAMVVLAWQGRAATSHWASFFRSTLDLSATDKIEAGGPLLFWSSVEVFRWIVPFMSAAFVLAVASGLAQGGFVFAGGSLALKFDRLNPAQKLSQMFSLTGLSGILKSLLPFAAVAYAGALCLEGHWQAIVSSSYLGMGAFARLVGVMLLEVGWKAGLIMLVWAGVDYFLSWRKHEGDLRMSREDLREELKDTDGNPQIKARIRRIQRQVRRRQLLKATETATVVITNPTHYAIALRYELDMDAPVVVAKGRGLIAEKIKEIARWREIPMMENKPLAQALYKSVEVGQTIPSKLYTAVAEILVVVYRAQAEVRAREARRRSASASGKAERQA